MVLDVLGLRVGQGAVREQRSPGDGVERHVEHRRLLGRLVGILDGDDGLRVRSLRGEQALLRISDDGVEQQDVELGRRGEITHRESPALPLPGMDDEKGLVVNEPQNAAERRDLVDVVDERVGRLHQLARGADLRAELGRARETCRRRHAPRAKEVPCARLLGQLLLHRLALGLDRLVEREMIHAGEARLGVAGGSVERRDETMLDGRPRGLGRRARLDERAEREQEHLRSAPLRGLDALAERGQRAGRALAVLRIEGPKDRVDGLAELPVLAASRRLFHQVHNGEAEIRHRTGIPRSWPHAQTQSRRWCAFGAAVTPRRTAR